MTRETFEGELHRLKDDVVQMGVRAGQAISRAVEALRTRDVALAEQVVAADDAIDAMHLELERRCMRLLATQQPMAGDLRTIASVFAITIDLERMADHAEGISRATKRLGLEPLVKPLVDIPAMEARIQEMLRETLEAFRAQDARLAVQAAAKDDLVDELRNRVLHDLLDVMVKDPQTISRALELLIVARHLERAADHITNIRERARSPPARGGCESGPVQTGCTRRSRSGGVRRSEEWSARWCAPPNGRGPGCRRRGSAPRCARLLRRGPRQNWRHPRS